MQGKLKGCKVYPYLECILQLNPKLMTANVFWDVIPCAMVYNYQCFLKKLAPSVFHIEATWENWGVGTGKCAHFLAQFTILH
jgi:hypothetical protein